MTEVERIIREWKLVADHGQSSQQVRSVSDPLKENNEIRDKVRNIGAASETEEKIDSCMCV